MNSSNEDANDPRVNTPPDYLWDKSGDPDSEIQGLEALLARFQHSRSDLELSEMAPASRWRFFLPQMRMLPAFAFAAALVVISLAAFLYLRTSKATPASGWSVSRVSGTPKVGHKSIGERSAAATFKVGQVLETDSASRASLQDDSTGQIEVDPSTRLRLLNSATGPKRIALDRGTIHAYIWADPGQFVVETPSAVAVDLGCEYTLHVDDSGSGTIRTSLGWVGFKLNGHEAFITAGAACATKPKTGPGTPYFEDASAEFRSALSRFDFDDVTPQQRDEDLTVVLAQARKRDALTLWHLLSRVDESQRAAVYDRLATLAPPPKSVTREGVLQLDQPMIDSWWNELGFDDISVWRYWERSWSEAPESKR